MFDRKILPDNFNLQVGDFQTAGYVRYGTGTMVGENFVYDENDHGDGVYIGNGALDAWEFLCQAILAKQDKAGKMVIVRGKRQHEEEDGYFVLATASTGEGKTKTSFPVILFIQSNRQVFQVYETNDMTAEETQKYWDELPDLK